MFDNGTVLLTVVAYAVFLFVVAQIAERTTMGKNLTGSASVFALGLAVYCTTWTFYGSVGKAASGGMGFLPVYLGPTLALIVGGGVFRKLASLKQRHRITSIADYVGARFGKSQTVAASVTVLLMIGIVPYIALQLKSVSSTISMLTSAEENGATTAAIVVFIVAFTIVFGIRHIDPTERHPGMVASLAVESVIKLTAFVAAGAFAVGAAFDSPADFLHHIDISGAEIPLLGKSSANDVITFITVTMLSASAFAFLPRQFHIGIVENSDPKHTSTARWLAPLYLFAINVLVLPIAIGGKIIATAGTSPDFYVLALPIQAGHRGLSLAVFIGGFSAAIGMIMVEAMTLATMISNHLVMPLAQAVPSLRVLRRRMLQVRWIAAAAMVIAGQVFYTYLAASYPLVSIGLISFAAAFVLVPVMIGGLLWPAASRAGALSSILLGGAMWFYTLMVPTFVKSKWLPQSLLDNGPFGLGFLRPEALLNVAGLPPLVHGVVFSSLVAGFAFVAGSLLFRASREERLMTEEFLNDDADTLAHLDAKAKAVDAVELRERARSLFAEYLDLSDADAQVTAVFAEVGVGDAERMSFLSRAEIIGALEGRLSGAIGSAAAHRAMKIFGKVDRKDRREIEAEFAAAIAELQLSPRELKQRIDFQQEREALLSEQFKSLEKTNQELESRVIERTQEIRSILDNVVFGFLVVGRDLIVRDHYTQSCHQLLAIEVVAGRPLADVLGLTGEKRFSLEIGCEQVFDDFLPESVSVSQVPNTCMQPDGRILRIEVRCIRSEKEVTGLLLTISDITDLESAQRENEGNRSLLSIMRQKPSFRAFIDDTRQGLNDASDALKSGDDVLVRRVAHTVKGNASLYGLRSVERLVHRIEEVERIEQEHLDKIADGFREFLIQHQELLQIDYDGSYPEQYAINEGHLSGLRLLQPSLDENGRALIYGLIKDVIYTPAGRLLGPVEAIVHDLSVRLGKEVDAEIRGGDIKVDPSVVRPVFSQLPHLLRNAIDHGIESPLMRGKKGKGHLVVSIGETHNGWSVTVEDDGRGIDSEAVAAAAVSKGVITAAQAAAMSTSDKQALIFLDGFSSADDVTEISGRGVGLAAVRAAVQSAGGVIEITTHRGEGTRFALIVPRRAA